MCFMYYINHVPHLTPGTNAMPHPDPYLHLQQNLTSNPTETLALHLSQNMKPRANTAAENVKHYFKSSRKYQVHIPLSSTHECKHDLSHENAWKEV